MNLIESSWQIILLTCLNRAGEGALTLYYSRIDGCLMAE